MSQWRIVWDRQIFSVEKFLLVKFNSEYSAERAWKLPERLGFLEVSELHSRHFLRFWKPPMTYNVLF